MKKKTHDALCSSLKMINLLLENDGLSEEERKKWTTLKWQTIGAIGSPWFPVGWLRKSIVIIIFLIWLYGIWNLDIKFGLIWLLMLFFSPRIVSGCAVFLGQVAREMNKNK